MPNIISVELTDLAWWNHSSNAWMSLYSKLGEASAVLMDKIKVYDNATGHNPATPLAFNVIWDNLNISGVSGHTIFGDVANMIPTSLRSVKLRYKIKTTSADDSYVTTASFYYQMLFLSFPDTGVITGEPQNMTGSVSASITVKFPSFTQAMLGGVGTPQGMQAYIANAAKWNITWTPPGGGAQNIQPSSVSMGNPVLSAEAEYGGYYVPVTIEVYLPVLTSGTYAMVISFYPNDASGATAQAIGMVYCTSTIVVNMATPLHPTIYAFDSSVAMQVTFNG